MADKKVRRLVIGGPLPGMNEILKAYSVNRGTGAGLKKKTDGDIQRCIRKQLKGLKIKSADFGFIWYEEHKQRDPDNIIVAHKFIMDALRKEGVLLNDGWKQINSIRDNWRVDAERPRVEVLIRVIEYQEEQGDLFNAS
jgi:Endodeoxyribonuclease RusA.